MFKIFHEETIKSDRIFEGNIISLRVDTVKLPNGNISTREIIEHPGGVGIIPITADREVIMVKQFRKAVEGISLEIPAGKLEYGEDPYECGARELEEETGYIANKIQLLGKFYSTPGFTNEMLHVYMATELIKGNFKPDTDELIEPLIIPLDKLVRMVMDGKINDAKTIIAILKVDKIL